MLFYTRSNSKNLNFVLEKGRFLMKLLNRLVNIVILLLAIATFTMSFLLYQKREQLVKGWEKMSKAEIGRASCRDRVSHGV